MRSHPPRAARPRWSPLGLALVAVVALTACEGDDGAPGRDGETPDLPLQPGAALPGFNIEVVGVEGNSGANGAFRPGDTIRVRYRVEDDDGDAITPDEWSRNAIYVSGPTFNYQRVLASRSDMVERSVRQPDGTWLYTFAEPIPQNYAEPLNYTGAITDGVLAGQALLSGTYSIGIEARRDVEFTDGSVERDTGNVVTHFLLGDATALDLREVSQAANCAQCHGELSFHGGNRTDYVGCLLCHTSGAEDGNDPAVANGTPGATIDFRVMIHKIHAGATLPSVLGMTTRPDGSRDYTATPKPYQLMGFRSSISDYSHVRYPRWPSLSQPMPRDSGYDNLSDEAQDKEDLQVSGPVDCASCHGDPDGDGELAAPADGMLAYSQPTIASCMSCHDDWVPEHEYVANGTRMPPQNDNAACTLCHEVEGGPLDVITAHIHPLLNPARNPGLRFRINSVTEGRNGDGSGTVDVGEGIAVNFDILDAADQPVAPSELSRFELTVAGPTENPNLLHLTGLPTAALTGAPPFVMNVPEAIGLEFAATSTSNLESFGTGRAPHWNVAGAMTTVSVRPAGPPGGASGALAVEADAWQNFVDLNAGEGAGFARNDVVVLADGVSGQEEYLRVQLVDGDRLWFGAINTTKPYGLRMFHAAGTTVDVVQLTALTAGVDYTLDAAAGSITELVEFGDGAKVLVDYTTDFLIPQVYTGTLNQSPDLDSSAGDWTGLPVASGTYQLNLSARRSFSVTVLDEVTSYSSVSPPANTPFLVGNATAIQLPERIDSAASCYACHGDIEFHGAGRRGYENCTQCHAVAGAEDRPQYVAPNAPPTTGVTIDFRTMLHKIHHGSRLSAGADYIVNGFGSGFPNNFTPHSYEDVAHPIFLGGTADCASCHGPDNMAWQEPAPRDHPLGQPMPTRSWKMACITCHDSRDARAHADTNTSALGEEACGTCHGPGKQLDVVKVHRTR